jgi:hypothetical protein
MSESQQYNDTLNNFVAYMDENPENSKNPEENTVLNNETEQSKSRTNRSNTNRNNAHPRNGNTGQRNSRTNRSNTNRNKGRSVTNKNPNGNNKRPNTPEIKLSDKEKETISRLLATIYYTTRFNILMIIKKFKYYELKYKNVFNIINNIEDNDEYSLFPYNIIHQEICYVKRNYSMSMYLVDCIKTKINTEEQKINIPKKITENVGIEQNNNNKDMKLIIKYMNEIYENIVKSINIENKNKFNDILTNMDKYDNYKNIKEYYYNHINKKSYDEIINYINKTINDKKYYIYDNIKLIKKIILLYFKYKIINWDLDYAYPPTDFLKNIIDEVEKLRKYKNSKTTNATKKKQQMQQMQQIQQKKHKKKQQMQQMQPKKTETHFQDYLKVKINNKYKYNYNDYIIYVFKYYSVILYQLILFLIFIFIFL